MASIIKANELQDFGGNSIITSDGAGTVTVNAAAMKNTPAFFAYASANKDITNNTDTKVEIDTEILDSDGKFDTSNNRFTPTVAGYYMINGIARFDATTTISSARIKIYKNGSLYYEVDVFKDTEDFSLSISQVVYLDTDDYVELYVRQNSGSTVPINGSDPLNSVSASFSGYKLIGA